MGKLRDDSIDWATLDESRLVSLERDIAQTTQNILILSQNIATLNDVEDERVKLVPRREELIAALQNVLNDEYDILDNQTKVKAIRDLGLKTYIPKTRTRKKVASPRHPQQFGSFAEMLKDIQDKMDRGELPPPFMLGDGGLDK